MPFMIVPHHLHKVLAKARLAWPQFGETPYRTSRSSVQCRGFTGSSLYHLHVYVYVLFVGDMANATIIVRSMNVIDDAEFLFFLNLQDLKMLI